MEISVVTLVPEMVKQIAGYGVVGRAIDNSIVGLHCVNPRDFATDTHRTVDDRPYGGGPGMVMKFEPIAAAVEQAKEAMPEGSRVICMSPQGRPFDQATAQRLSKVPGMIVLAGRYE